MISKFLIISLTLLVVKAQLLNDTLYNMSFPSSVQSYSGLFRTINDEAYFLTKDSHTNDYYLMKATFPYFPGTTFTKGSNEVKLTFTLPEGYTPLTYAINTGSLAVESNYIVVLDAGKKMKLLIMDAGLRSITSEMDIDSTYSFTEKIYFAHHTDKLKNHPAYKAKFDNPLPIINTEDSSTGSKSITRTGEEDCNYIYYCSSITTNRLGNLFGNGIVSSYLGRIDTCFNLVAPIVKITLMTNTRCAGLIKDDENKNIIAAFETLQNKFEGISFGNDVRKDEVWEPIEETTKQNIAIVAYSYDLQYKKWATIVGDDNTTEYLIGLQLSDNTILAAVNATKSTSSSSARFYQVYRTDGVLSTTKDIAIQNKAVDIYATYQGVFLLCTTPIDSKLQKLTILPFDWTNFKTAKEYIIDASLVPLAIRGLTTFSKDFPRFVFFAGSNEKVSIFTTNEFYSKSSSASASSSCSQLINGEYCRPCYYLCSTCSAPFSCSTCVDNKMQTGDCTKPNGNVCRKNTLFTNDGVCLKRCPDGKVPFYSRDPKENTAASLVTTNPFFLKFSEKNQGLKLQAPNSFNNKTFPEEWTIMLWVKGDVWPETLNVNNTVAHLVNAYNHIFIDRVYHPKNKNGYIEVKIGDATITPTTVSIQTSNVLVDQNWTFVAVSKGIYYDESMNKLIKMSIYASSANQTRFSQDLSYTLNSTKNNRDVRPGLIEPTIILGALGAKDPDGSLTKNDSFIGYMMNFKMFSRYMEPLTLKEQKNHSHSDNQPDMLAYWKFNPTTDDTLIKDSSPYGKTGSLVDSSIFFEQHDIIPDPEPVVPKPGEEEKNEPVDMSARNEMIKKRSFNAIRIYKWDEKYDCFYPFTDPKKLPPFAISGSVYDELLTFVDSIDNSKKGIIIKEHEKIISGDSIYVTENNCSMGDFRYLTKKIFKIQTNAENNEKTFAIESNNPFSSLVPGTNYRLCYKSIVFGSTHLLNWIYIAQGPQAVIPRNSIIYKGNDKVLEIKISGGDNSYDGKVYVANNVDDIINIKSDTAVGSGVKKMDGLYVMKVDGLLERSYNVYWRPAYSEEYNYFQQIPSVTIKVQLYPKIAFGISQYEL